MLDSGGYQRHKADSDSKIISIDETKPVVRTETEINLTERIESIKEHLYFLKRMKEIATEKLAGLDLAPVMVADMELALESLSFEMLDHLNYLEPTGYGNPRPVFVSRNVQVKSSRTVGRDQSHLKLTVTDGKATLDAIAFRLGHLKPDLPARIDLLYTFEVNEWKGRKSLQLNVKDIKF